MIKKWRREALYIPVKAYKWNLINTTSEQNRTIDMEIKNKLTVTGREGEGYNR